jgi:hypothetical protein
MKNCFQFFKKRTLRDYSVKMIKVWRLLPFLILLLSLTNISAQSIEKLNDRLEFPKVEDNPNLKSLVGDLHPSVYLEQMQQKKFGKDYPLIAFCDAASVNMLYNENPDFNMVKMIELKINSTGDKDVTIDLSKLQSFSKLKYLCIIFTYNPCNGQSDDCLANIVQGMVNGNMSGVSVVYQLSIPN